jgi:N-acetylneuraminate synthase
MRGARWAGCQSIKFQTYSADRIAARWAPTYWDSGGAVTQHDIFASRSLLSEADYQRLFDEARALGIMLLSTPFDVDAAGMLENLGMAAYKIASADITNFPLLKTVASFGKPVIMSTGAAEMDEIDAAVKLVSEAGAPVALLHCTLTYPTPIPDANLRKVQALAQRYPDRVIGYSDHTQPQDTPFACPAAVALGARIIEKHYTLNKALPEDDHYHAVDQAGLCRLVKDCKDAFAMTRSFEPVVESEHAARQLARRSIVAAADLPAGTVLETQHVDFKRPGTGLSPAKLDALLGRKLTRAVEADGLISLDDVE